MAESSVRVSMSSVGVRMYHVGFGDCFLLRFPNPDRERLVLIDCGVHSASQGGHPLDVVVEDVIRQARVDGSSPRIDVVVATHRHRDHVHGFRDSRWGRVEVGEVWLPWTEDPDDDDARRIRDRQSKRARLLLSLAASGSGGRWEAIRAIAENNDGYTNAAAMTTLHGGFAGTPTRFFLPQKPGGPRSSAFSTPVLPRVMVHILGPLRTEQGIRDIEPPASQSYLRLGAADEIAPSGRTLPFDSMLLDEDDYKAQYRHLLLKPGDLGAIVNAGREDALGLAVALESAVNGTSLMLLFRFGNVALLFPGDSQWGTWDHLLGNPAQRDLVDTLTVYKVGHHGSHNATPRRFVETNSWEGTVALVPVGPTTIPSWSQIPRKPLLEALRERGAYVIRSDKSKDAGADPAAQAPNVKGKATFADDGLWTELRLPGGYG